MFFSFFLPAAAAAAEEREEKKKKDNIACPCQFRLHGQVDAQILA
jgi:hypothetical protein